MQQSSSIPVSVCTIAAGREDHLLRIVAGLSRGEVLPTELVIVTMGEALPESVSARDWPFPIVQHRVERIDGNLPLALARNTAVRQAHTDLLVFLDVDCIPAADFLNHHLQAQARSEQLWMGTVRYLREGWDTDRTAEPDLFEQSEYNDLQPDLKPGEWTSNSSYEKFWSLNFSISRQLFDQVDGFTETYIGYGGEDTDFAFKIKEAGIPFGHIGALAFHQFHSSASPPTQHLEAIIRNSHTFHQRWGIWPMRKWLEQFHQLRLVEFDPENNLLEKREPA